MSTSYKNPRSEPRARRGLMRTTGRNSMPSRGGTNPLRLEHTWSGPDPTMSSTPSNNPFYIPPNDTAPPTPDMEAFKRSFPDLTPFSSGGGRRENQHRDTPTPLTRRHAVIIKGLPLGAERRMDAHIKFPPTDAEPQAIASTMHSSPISIKIESSPTQLQLVLRGILPNDEVPKDAGSGSYTEASSSQLNQPGPSKRSLDSPVPRSPRNHKVRKTLRTGSSARNPIDELVIQWAREALEEEQAVTGEERYHLPKFRDGPPARKQTRYSLRDRAKVVKRQAVVLVGRTAEDYVNLHPAFFRKAAIRSFNPRNPPVATIDLLHELCSRTPRGLTVGEFSKVFLQCQTCTYYHYAESLGQHSCSAMPVQTTEYSSVEYDIGIDFLSYRRRGISEEQLYSIFISCTLCDRVFLRKYNRSHVCDSDI